jgi:hypothetical protein
MSKSTTTHATTQGKAGPQLAQPTRTMASAKVDPRQRSAESQPAGAKIAPEQRPQLIAQAAYFIAERRGFAPGNELEDWLQAEAEIEACLKAALQ